MNRHLLCDWLGLPGDCWPPDNYALVGVAEGAGCDAAQIEQKVHERLAKLRGYQLSHPEEATEGMNRLAQAYICLTDSLARKTANAQDAMFRQFRAVNDDTAVTGKTQLELKPPTPEAPVATAPVATAPETKVEAAPRPVPMVDPIRDLAWHSIEASRGLGTLEKVIDRVDRTRKMLCAWTKAGCYLQKPRRRPLREAEKKDLERRLDKVFRTIDDFPAIVGRPGKPGYRVVAMARLEMTALLYESMDQEQREHLARDWQAGHAVLLSHRSFLRQRFKTMRREGIVRRGLRALRASINDHPVRAILLAAVGIGMGLASYLYWF